MHKPIHLTDLSLSFTNKSCFENFSAQIYPGSRIAIIGRNGSGKSSLLNILRKNLEPSSGEVSIPDGLCIGYVEQTIEDYKNLSGGQRLNKKLSQALALSPDILLLDEPTNHLDLANRKSLIRMLKSYPGTLVIVSHDTELLRECTDLLWHIDHNKIYQFSGMYDDYICEIKQKRTSIEKALLQMKHEKKDMHAKLMKEQGRAAKSKQKGKKGISQRKWPTVTSTAKALRAEKTSGKKKSAIDKKKQDLTDKLSMLRLPDIIMPSFSINSCDIQTGNIITISDADIGYDKDKDILTNVSLSLSSKERIAISGKNASGKSTLLKAILGQEGIFTTGSWNLPCRRHIGYLDQHYSNLKPKLSVIEHIKELNPEWSEVDVRRHLNDFIFRKNEEVMQLAADLSGGEKARLSLALIAAKTPKLLILDEVTNNLDLETKEYIIQVLQAYPGAMIIISHEAGFLKSVGVEHIYKIDRGSVSQGT